MKRYISKEMRRLGINFFETKKYSSRRFSKQGWEKKFLKRKSLFGKRLLEKQRLLFHYYPNNEGEIKFIYKKLRDPKKLIIFLETQLVCVVYRSLFAISKAQACQLISSGNVFVNGKKVDVPRSQVNIGDEITLKPEMLTNEKVKNALDSRKETLSFIKLDREKLVATLVNQPELEDLDVQFNLNLISSWYNMFI